MYKLAFERNDDRWMWQAVAIPEKAERWEVPSGVWRS